MSQVLAFGLLGWDLSFEAGVIGAISGLTYAVLGAGLVLIFRATGIINFAHGEVGALAGAIFARVVLQAPPWLVMDEAFSAFDDDTLERIIDVLNGPLAHTGIIHIGSAGEAHDRLFTQVVHLVKVPNAVPEDLRP